jgi:hypothetical protein
MIEDYKNPMYVVVIAGLYAFVILLFFNFGILFNLHKFILFFTSVCYYVMCRNLYQRA